jgi:serine/threonine protein kinase/TolA-binding protein
LLVSYTGEVKLTDFGLASSTLKLEKTAPGIIYGKVAYMSPEQARGEKLDGRSDMYAAAIVLWELLTGRQMFPPGKDQPQDLLVRAKNPEPTRPSKRAPRVAVELDEICLKALAPSRDDRYPDCDAMRMALQAWLAQNAPTTDGTRMAAFLQELFAEDIQRERVERNELVEGVRKRALTLPPTDELRMIVEAGRGGHATVQALSDTAQLHDAPVRRPGSVGRRATDRQGESVDRRKAPDRRVSTRSLAAEGSSGSAALARQAQPQEDELDPDLIDAEIDGRYRVIELIGEGGMGKVYLAEHVEIGKRVALKVLHPSYSRMPDLVERFRREARAASKIGHPNIVDVTDSGTTADGSVYFVMEYLEGVELGSVIEREGALDVARALKITGQICRALSAAHREGIIHRDLKPENIFLITRDGTADVVKVLDFGIAKTTEAEAARERRLTSPGMAMGTPEYMSPEQAAGRPADARCDVYALGAIMYEMVTGIPPYSGDNFMEILTKKATVDPRPPILERPELPAQVSELVMAAMARSPDDRPQTMEALEYELNKCLSGRGVAVAQILGMTTDAHVVATLNPGLSMRTFDDAVVVPRAQTASPVTSMPRPGTHSGMSELPAMWSGPAMSTNQHALMARQGSDAGGSYPGQSMPSMPMRLQSSPSLQGLQAPALSDPGLPVAPPMIPQPRRSALNVLAWLTFAAVLFGAVGSLLYVALGERFARRQQETLAAGAGSSRAVAGKVDLRPDGSGGPGSSAAGSAVAAGSGSSSAVEPAAGSATRPAPAPSADRIPAAGAAEAAQVDHKSEDRGPRKHPLRPVTAKRPQVAAAENGDPRQLLKQATDLEGTGKWDDARAVWQRLEKYKTYRSEALYHQAWAAFQSNDTGAASKLAWQVGNEPGKFQIQAKFLYADALYRQGEYQRAKEFFVSLRKQLKGDDRATATKKIAWCNKMLNLPETNGIVP